MRYQVLAIVDFFNQRGMPIILREISHRKKLFLLQFPTEENREMKLSHKNGRVCFQTWLRAEKSLVLLLQKRKTADAYIHRLPYKGLYCF